MTIVAAVKRPFRTALEDASTVIEGWSMAEEMLVFEDVRETVPESSLEWLVAITGCCVGQAFITCQRSALARFLPTKVLSFMKYRRKGQCVMRHAWAVVKSWKIILTYKSS